MEALKERKEKQHGEHIVLTRKMYTLTIILKICISYNMSLFKCRPSKTRIFLPVQSNKYVWVPQRVNQEPGGLVVIMKKIIIFGITL